MACRLPLTTLPRLFTEPGLERWLSCLLLHPWWVDPKSRQACLLCMRGSALHLCTGISSEGGLTTWYVLGGQTTCLRPLFPETGDLIWLVITRFKQDLSNRPPILPACSSGS